MAYKPVVCRELYRRRRESRRIPAPVHQNDLDNLADPATRGMELWDMDFFVAEAALLVEDERIEHVRALRRQQTARARARKKKGA